MACRGSWGSAWHSGGQVTGTARVVRQIDHARGTMLQPNPKFKRSQGKVLAPHSDLQVVAQPHSQLSVCWHHHRRGVWSQRPDQAHTASVL